MSTRSKLALLIVSMVIPSLLAQTPPLPGRYLVQADLYNAIKNKGTTVGKVQITETDAQFYLMGIYDFTQGAAQSCATRGTTSPAQLEQVYASYVDAHGIPRDTLATHAQLQLQTAASIAAQAFIEAWPCANK
jgi:hypothetical protein